MGLIFCQFFDAKNNTANADSSSVYSIDMYTKSNEPVQPKNKHGRNVKKVDSRYHHINHSGTGYVAAYKHVRVHCFPSQLRDALDNISKHFGRKVLVTSGYRPNSNGYHGDCHAADIKISGVSPRAIGNYAKSIGMGGVGMHYHKTGHVHIDVRPTRYAYYW